MSETRSPDGSALRVLVADDDPIQRSLIGARLSRLNGQTVEAEDGVAAWALLSSQTFDMAIVDLSMPNLDGFGLIQGMRDHPRTRHLPIIVVTSRHDRAAIEAAMEVGASSFLVKPIAWSTFEHHVGFLLRMVLASKEGRAASQKAVALHRAREAIMANLCGEAISTVGRLMDEADTMRRLPASAESASLIQRRLGALLEQARAMNDQTARVSADIGRLSDRVAVSDRKERLDRIADAAATILAAAIHERALRVEITLPPGDIWVACDGDALQQAVVHLLENAIRHSPEGGRIELTARVYPDGLLGIEITDHGEGMHPDEMARSLAPLQSWLDGNRIGGRVGFGLIVAKAIAEAHSGTLELRSMPCEGTTALLVLPPERVTHIADEV